MHRKIKILLLLAVLVVFNGCKDQLPTEMAGLADQQSLQRLATLPEDSGLLLSLHSDGVLGQLPNLGPDGRELGRFGPTKLALVSRERVPALAKVDGLTGLVLWGDEKAVTKIDPMLRNAILAGMAATDWRETKYSVIATFADGTTNLAQSLADAGAVTGSITGNTATFVATSEVIFDILGRNDLRQLKKPDLQRPAQGLN